MRRRRHRGKLAPDTHGSPAAPLRYKHHLLTSSLQILLYELQTYCVSACYIRFLSPSFFVCIKGVTLTDLQEAEKTMKTDNKGREKREEEEKEKEAKMKKGEEGVRAIFHIYRACVGCAYMSCDVT